MPSIQLNAFIQRYLPGNVNDILNALNLYANYSNSSAFHKGELDQRVQQTSFDSQRYNRSPKDLVFWPNPIHPDHPNSIYSTKPYTSRTPILDKSTKIVTAGSCFASELSLRLQRNHYNYLLSQDVNTNYPYSQSDSCEGTLPFFSSRYGILFNTPSLLQLAQRAFSTRVFKRIVLESKSLYWDPYREGISFDSKQDYLSDYPIHTDSLSYLLTNMDVFVFTLGLSEGWRFIDDKTFISRNPRITSLYPLIEFHKISLEENIACLKDFYKLVKTHNPSFKLILTLSPIPLIATGDTTQHVITANCEAKSLLRTAISQVTEAFSDIYYFPAYEYVTSCIKSPWAEDARHVSSSTADRVFDLFMDMYEIK